MIAPFEALAAVPDELTSAEAAPLLCAGITTFNALRHSGFGPGDLVAVLGIGGLGHLGVQFAAKMGCRTVAVARGANKGPLALQLGAHHYIDSTSQNVAAELMKLGGARVILATLTDAKSMSDSEDTMDFSMLSAIRPLIETYPLERASDAYERMMSGKARFRVVLTTDTSDH